MTMQFCKECNNLLHPKLDLGTLSYICNRCETITEPSSPVIFTRSFVVHHDSNMHRKRDLVSDVTLPIFNKKCAECGNEKCVMYMEKNEEKALNSYYVCTKCFHEWTDS